MNATALTPRDVERALWTATGCGVLAAIGLTYLVYRLQSYVTARTRMHVLAALIALILLCGVVVACDTIVLTAAYFQIYQIDRESVLAGSVFIHVGWLHRLILFLAVVATWATLARVRNNGRGESTGGLTSR